MGVRRIREHVALRLARYFGGLYLRYYLAQRADAVVADGRRSYTQVIDTVERRTLLWLSVDRSAVLQVLQDEVEALRSLNPLHAWHHAHIVEIGQAEGVDILKFAMRIYVDVIVVEFS